MPKPNQDWTVLPHGPLTQLAADLFTVVGQLKMPLGESRRRMTVVRLSGGRLLLYSAIALDDATMQQLEALGKPAFLVVPNGMHRLDIAPWKRRYPGLVVIAPSGARARVSEVVPVDATQMDFGDARVDLSVIAGTEEQELALMVETETGKTLVLTDLIFNLPKLHGPGGMVMRLLGFGPGRPHMPKLVMLKLLKDKQAVRSQLQRWAHVAGLERVLVAHGLPIEAPQSTLLELAEALA